MSMKKLLACLLALMMALALVACGGDTAGDDANVDDQSPAVEDDANTGAGAGTPLETMTFVEVPEYIVGSRWEFCGGFVNGTEMSDEQATNTLKGCNGVLEIDFNDVDAVDYLNGDTVLTGSCGTSAIAVSVPCSSSSISASPIGSTCWNTASVNALLSLKHRIYSAVMAAVSLGPAGRIMTPSPAQSKTSAAEQGGKTVLPGADRPAPCLPRG